MPRPDPVCDFASTAEPGRLKDLVYCSKMEEHVYSRVRYEYDEVNIVFSILNPGRGFATGRRAGAAGGPGARGRNS
jgi:hypothetical protein